MTCRSKIAIIVPIGNPRWPSSWKSIFRFFYCTEMPVDSKVGRRHWGWLVLLVTFWKFQHFNLVSKIFQKLFKPLPCHKSIGKMLHAICISAVAVSFRWASCGPWASCFVVVFYFTAYGMKCPTVFSGEPEPLKGQSQLQLTTIFFIFSSPELCSGWAIVITFHPSVRPSIRPSVRPLTFSNNFSSEAAEPILLKFHMEPY